jgi:hypothetical protein
LARTLHTKFFFLFLIDLTNFRYVDERKKIFELKNLREYPDEDIRKELIEAGRGNPRLIEALNHLLKVEEVLDVINLLRTIIRKTNIKG